MRQRAVEYTLASLNHNIRAWIVYQKLATDIIARSGGSLVLRAEHDYANLLHNGSKVVHNSFKHKILFSQFDFLLTCESQWCDVVWGKVARLRLRLEIFHKSLIFHFVIFFQLLGCVRKFDWRIKNWIKYIRVIVWRWKSKLSWGIRETSFAWVLWMKWWRRKITFN